MMVTQMYKLAAAVTLLNSVACASQVEVVIAHYSEDLAWVSKIPDDVNIRIYTKGSQDVTLPTSGTVGEQLPNVGRESHTYLHHIVNNYERLADWTVFTQAGAPSFGYKGHRSGGGHLLAGDDFAKYLMPDPSGSRFVYTSVVHLPSMDHLLRAAYCINDELLEGGGTNMCPKEASHWTSWWGMGEFRNFVFSKVESQHGEEIMDFYRKYINPSYTGDEVMAFFPQGARFAVSRETIQRRPKSDYERLLSSLSHSEDSYAGYYMEWLWSEFFLGHAEPCPVPPKLVALSHAEAMDNLAYRFPVSHSKAMRQLTAVGGSVSGSGCVCAGVSAGVSGSVSSGISSGISGGVSGGVSGGIFSGISGSISGSMSGSISGRVSGSISGSISGSVSGDGCICSGVSGGISGGVSGGISGGVSSGISGGISGGVSGGSSESTSVTATTIVTTTAGVIAESSSKTTTSTTLVGSTVTQVAGSTATTTTTTSYVNNTGIRVAGTLQVELDVNGTLLQDFVEDIFKRALAVALGVPIELVVKLDASELDQDPGLRRLQPLLSSIQDSETSHSENMLAIPSESATTWYEVSYEVIVPSHMDADSVMEKANRIAEPGSAESLLFRESLEEANGVLRVGKIVAKISAYKLEDGATTAAPPGQTDQDKDETDWTALVIGAVSIVFVVSCLLTGTFMMKRKIAPAESSPATTAQGVQEDVETGLKVVTPNTAAPTRAAVATKEAAEADADHIVNGILVSMTNDTAYKVHL